VTRSTSIPPNSPYLTAFTMTSLPLGPVNQQPDGGCAEINSRSSRGCSLTSLSAGKADCRRIASQFSGCSVLTEDLPSVGLV